MDIRVQVLDCDKCGQQHKIEIDFDQLSNRQKRGLDPVLDSYICPNIALMYRAFGFALDTRVSAIKSFREHGLAEQERSLASQLKTDWGDANFEDKLDRLLSLDLAFLGIPEEYYTLLNSVVSTYCCGYFYPAITSAGALGERILNRLVIKLRDHFKSSEHYRKIHRKASFDQWDTPIKILKDWGVISEKVSKTFLELKKYRNDSIHYNDGYCFEANAQHAVKALGSIIDLQFNYVNRRDLFWVFDVPGEIWLRSEVINDPFVVEFVLPHCALLGPSCEPSATPPVKTEKFPLKPITDEDFLNLRKNRKSE
jgi:hypothetical protein